MATKKYSVLAVLDVLKEYSDEEHCLKIKDIKEHIKKPPYKIDVSEKTIRSDLRALYDFGYDIRFANSYSRVMVHSDGTVLDSDINTGCYLVGDVSDEDIEILHDALLSERFLSSRKYSDLVDTLTYLSSTVDFDLHVKGAARVPRDIVSGRILYDNMRMIRQAIAAKKVISFKCVPMGAGNLEQWDRGKERFISPGRVFSEDGIYYLAGYEKLESGNSEYVILRVELMRNIKQVDKPRYNEYDIHLSGLRTPKFAKKRFKLVPDDKCEVTFRFSKSIIQQVADYFGSRRLIIVSRDKGAGDESVTVETTAPSEAILKFAKMYAPDVEIVSPVELRDALKKDFAAAAKKHK